MPVSTSHCAPWQQLVLMQAIAQAPHRILTRLPQRTLLGPALAVLQRLMKACAVAGCSARMSCNQHSSRLCQLATGGLIMLY